jgi:alpha-beta hydrolase superfamily lysophospholipase
VLDERRSLDLPVVLMGHSLGGLIVARYLTDGRPAPDLAVLSAPALDAEAPGWQRALAPVLGSVLPRLRIGSDYDGSVLTRDEQVQRAYEEDPLRVPFTTARLGREVLRAMEATRITLDRLRIPTFVVHGADDPLVPPAASEPLGKLPNVDRVLWPGLRHEPHNEPEQDEVLAAIVAWIDTHL